MLTCPKHPKYKGLTPTKRNCDVCKALYNEVQKSSKEYGKYHSITTPHLKCGIVHLMSELSCVMLYGPQPPFFWRKKTPSHPAAKKYFTKVFTNLKSWLKKNKDILRPTEVVLYNIYFKEFQKTQLKNKHYVETETPIKKPKKIYNCELKITDDNPNSKWSAIKKLDKKIKTNGKEKS